MKKLTIFVLLTVVALALVACGGGGDAGGGDAGADLPGDSAAGEELFAQPVIGTQAGCSTCHSLNADEVIVGPSIAGIASRAGSTVSGQSAEDYLRESILNPNAYVVEGFAEGVMVQVWQEELTSEQVDDLVSYLLTLE